MFASQLYNFSFEASQAPVNGLASSRNLITVLNSIKDLLSDYDVCVSSENSVNRFYALPPDMQNAIYLRIENCYNFLKICSVSSIDIRSNVECLKFVFKLWKLEVPTDLLNHVTDDDVVEMYDNSFVQIYRNMKCLQLTSYDLLELSSRDWMELYIRDESVSHLLIEEAIGLIKSPTSLYTSKVSAHLLIESISDEKRKMIIQNKYGASLLNAEGDVVGFIATQSARLLPANTSVGFLRSQEYVDL